MIQTATLLLKRAAFYEACQTPTPGYEETFLVKQTHLTVIFGDSLLGKASSFEYLI